MEEIKVSIVGLPNSGREALICKFFNLQDPNVIDSPYFVASKTVNYPGNPARSAQYQVDIDYSYPAPLTRKQLEKVAQRTLVSDYCIVTVNASASVIELKQLDLLLEHSHQSRLFSADILKGYKALAIAIVNNDAKNMAYGEADEKVITHNVQLITSLARRHSIITFELNMEETAPVHFSGVERLFDYFRQIHNQDMNANAVAKYPKSALYSFFANPPKLPRCYSPELQSTFPEEGIFRNAPFLTLPSRYLNSGKTIAELMALNQLQLSDLVKIPESLKDPVSLDILENPYINCAGLTYSEKKNGDPLGRALLVENHLMARLIEIWRAHVNHSTINSASDFPVSFELEHVKNQLTQALVCPLSKKMMSSPYINTETGETIDRSSINEKDLGSNWIRNKAVSSVMSALMLENLLSEEDAVITEKEGTSLARSYS